VSKNRVTATAKVTAELSVYLQGPVSTQKKCPTRASQIQCPRQSCNW